MIFSEIIGQNDIVEYLQNGIVNHMVSHAYMFVGEKHAGKMMLAKTFAAALLCEEGGIEPCGKCQSCSQTKSGNNPDIRYVTHEKTATISVDDIREQIVNDAFLRPYAGKYKVYIIDEAEKMNAAAQNALLKTIEEPPTYVVVILLTANAEVILDTIRSRCVKLPIHPVQEEEIARFLVLKTGITQDEAMTFAAFSQGNVGKALLYVEDEEFNELLTDVVDEIRRIRTIPSYEMMEEMEGIEKKYKIKSEDYINLLVFWFRDVLLYKSIASEAKLIFRGDEYLAQIKRYASDMSFDGINRIFAALDKARARIRANVSFKLTLEMLFLAIKEET